MSSKTKSSGRADLFLRVEPQFKDRLAMAAKENGLTLTDWALDLLEGGQAAYEARRAGDKRKADLEVALDAKFVEIVALMPSASRAKADHLLQRQEAATAAIDNWRSHASSNHYAEPRTALECLCAEYTDMADELARGQVQRINTLDEFDSAVEDEFDDEDDVDDE
jgi:hypothetical protein